MVLKFGNETIKLELCIRKKKVFYYNKMLSHSSTLWRLEQKAEHIMKHWPLCVSDSCL